MCLKPVKLATRGYVPCGCCIECLEQRSNEWAARMVIEAEAHKQNCFITLTFDDAHCPDAVSVREHQLFMKSLRKAIAPVKIRFFMCGEYGGLNNRPHYHYVIFGWQPPDMKFLKISKSGELLYTSEFLAALWPKGFHSVAAVTYKSCKYTAKYLQKLDDRPHAVLAFTRCSTRPGIGDNLLDDPSNVKAIMDTDKIYAGKTYVATPRFYLKRLERDGVDISGFSFARQMKPNLYDHSPKAMAARLSSKLAALKSAGFDIKKLFYKKSKKIHKNLDNEADLCYNIVAKSEKILHEIKRSK